MTDGQRMNVETASLIQAESLRSQVSTSVAVKTLDVAKEQGRAAVALLESAASVQKSTTPSASHSGGIDVTG